MLRTIGDPQKRFKQDPVVCLGFLKFHARFSFQIESVTEQAIHSCRQEIVKSSPARILEEILRMLESERRPLSSVYWRNTGFCLFYFLIYPIFLRTSSGKLIFHYLASADQLYKHKGKNVLERPVLVACLLFPILEKELERRYLSKKQTPHIGEITLTVTSLIKEVFTEAFSHFPRRIGSIMASILVAQYRLTPLSGKRHYRENYLDIKNLFYLCNF